jgi:hypothetical protein
MTMDFKLANEGLRSSISPGMKVEFTFSDPKDPVVSALKVLR